MRSRKEFTTAATPSSITLVSSDCCSWNAYLYRAIEGERERGREGGREGEREREKFHHLVSSNCCCWNAYLYLYILFISIFISTFMYIYIHKHIYSYIDIDIDIDIDLGKSTYRMPSIICSSSLWSMSVVPIFVTTW